MEPNSWARCSICGKTIHYDQIYYACSVSGCNRKSSPHRFCSVDCWDAHVADRNHRNAECVEEQAPAR